MTNPPPNFVVFAKLMEMTTSSNDSEALVAVRKANAMLGRIGRSWTELLEGKVTMMPGSPFEAIPDPFAKEQPKRPKSASGPRHDSTTDPDIDSMFDALLVGPRRITTSFRAFVEDVHDWWQNKGFLSHGQFSAIKKAYDRL